MPFIRLFVVWTLWSDWCFFALLLLYRIRVFGRRHVPRTGPLIYVSNHQSHFDPPIVGMIANDRPCAFLARSTLFDVPIFGPMIRFMNAVPLDRDKGSAGAIRAALGELKEGRCVLVFPEGTRTSDGTIKPFKGGILLLLRKTGARVVPVAIEGAHDAWPQGRPAPKLHGRILAKAGAPIEAETLLDMDPDAALGHLHETIDTMRRELRDQILRESNGRYPRLSAP